MAKINYRTKPGIRNWLKITFITAMFCWGVSLILPEILPTLFEMLFSMVWVVSSITSFVLSIIHLCKYTDGKGFAITALTLTALLNGLFAIGILIGILELVI